MTTTRIGLLMDQTTSYGRSVHAGLRRALLPRCDRSIVVHEPTPSGAEALRAAEPAAIIAFVHREEVAAALDGWSAPLVNVSYALDLEWPRVGIDDRAIGRLAADYLLQRGFRQAAWLGHPDRHYSRQRHDGFVEFFRQTGGGVEDGPAAATVGEDQLAAWLASLRDPCALFVVGDEHALRATKCAIAAGLAVPDRLAILSATYDEEVCTAIKPGISGVSLPGLRVGAEAAALLDRLLAGDTIEPGPVLVPPTHVIEHDSTNLDAVDDLAIAAALRFVRAHLVEPIGVEQVAEAVGVGRRQLERRFAGRLGRSIYQEIMRLRVERAKHLLATTDDTLDAVGTACGFAGAQHLLDVFKRKTGLTPGRYRREVAGRDEAEA